MKKFIVIYHAPLSVLAKWQSMKPEEHKKGMEEWMVWAKKCGSALIDMGAPLSNGQKLSESGGSPSKKDVVGYSILQANSMDEAKKLLMDHPHLKQANGCDIEVYETMPHSM